MFRPLEEFTTARMAARPPRIEDAPAVFATYASDPEVTRYLSWPAYRQIEPLAAYLHGAYDAWDRGHGHYSWLLHLRTSGELVGSIGFTYQPGQALFGYVLGRAHWGQGLMPEALTWLVQWCQAQPEIFRSWAFCDTANPASARVMEKAGMTREALVRRWHVCPEISPEPRDCFMYAKTR